MAENSHFAINFWLFIVVCLSISGPNIQPEVGTAIYIGLAEDVSRPQVFKRSLTPRSGRKPSCARTQSVQNTQTLQQFLSPL